MIKHLAYMNIYMVEQQQYLELDLPERQPSFFFFTFYEQIFFSFFLAWNF